MRLLRILLPLAALLASAPLSASASCLDPEDPPLTVDAPTLSVTISTPRSTYRPRETALIVARVRTLAGSKVAKAVVTVDLTRGGRLIKRLHGGTNASGDSRIAFKVPTAAGATVDAFATARLEAVPSYDCRAALVYQYGEKTAQPFFTIG